MALLPEDTVLENRQLTAEELAAMRQIMAAASQQELFLQAQKALGTALKDDGYGLPLLVSPTIIAVIMITLLW